MAWILPTKCRKCLEKLRRASGKAWCENMECSEAGKEIEPHWEDN